MDDTSPARVEDDSRGILHPAELRRVVRLTRYPPGRELEGLVDRFWSAEWDLPPGVRHSQQVLTHPCANLSVSHADARSGTRMIEARLNGVARDVTTRVLAGRGWAIAAMTTPGGLGAFLTGPASAFTDRVVPLGPALGLDEAKLIEEVTGQPDAPGRAETLARYLARVIETATAPQVSGARQVADAARIAQTDRSVRRLGHLSARTGLGARTLQRLFLRHAGVSPTWALRRYRLIDAAETVREGQRVDWAALAAGLGYADQAHLIREFRTAVGQTPAAYAQSQPPPAPNAVGHQSAGRRSDQRRV